MSMRVSGKNTGPLSSLRNAAENRAEEKKSFEKLSSGKRINQAADDAAGLAMAEKLGATLKGLEQGMENVYDGLSMIETAEAGLGSTSNQLGRMRELAVSAASDTLSSGQRDAIQAEFSSLSAEIDRTAASTEFNGQQLLDGSAGEVNISLGYSAGSEPDAIAMDLSHNMDAASLGLASTSLGGADGSNARAALEDIDNALAAVNSQRADFGGTANRLMSAHQGLAVTTENAYASQSRIMDTDYAKETAELTRKQILSQIGAAVTVQGRLMPSSVMSLLK
jgi:flagellin